MILLFCNAPLATKAVNCIWCPLGLEWAQRGCIWIWCLKLGTRMRWICFWILPFFVARDYHKHIWQRHPLEASVCNRLTTSATIPRFGTITIPDCQFWSPLNLRFFLPVYIRSWGLPGGGLMPPLHYPYLYTLSILITLLLLLHTLTHAHTSSFTTFFLLSISLQTYLTEPLLFCYLRNYSSPTDLPFIPDLSSLWWATMTSFLAYAGNSIS